MRRKLFFGLAAAATLCGTALVAQEAMKSKQIQEAAAPSPAALARMAPGPMHAKLEALVGNWKMTGKWRMTPEAPWSEFEADVYREWVLGKRFVKETVKSEFMGQPFEGIGFIGYDNTSEQFTMTWIENMSTSTWFNTGKLQGDKIIFEGENPDAWTGEKKRWGKSVLDISTHVYKGYAKDASGQEFTSMEMTAKKM